MGHGGKCERCTARRAVEPGERAAREQGGLVLLRSPGAWEKGRRATQGRLSYETSKPSGWDTRGVGELVTPCCVLST